MDQAVEQVLYAALGGQPNIIRIDPYRMRIRVHVRSQALVEEDALRIAPVLAVVRTQDFVQIVAGEPSQHIGERMIELHTPSITENV